MDQRFTISQWSDFGVNFPLLLYYYYLLPRTGTVGINGEEKRREDFVSLRVRACYW
jgi:hypothetical protein